MKKILILTVIQGFAKMYNLSSITACLPILASAGQPIPWGIIPINLSVVIQYDNLTLQNRRALDLLLAKEQGGCGYLKLDWDRLLCSHP